MDKTKLRQAISNALQKSIDIRNREYIVDDLVDAVIRENTPVAFLPPPTGDVVSDWTKISIMHYDQEQAEQAMLDRLEAALGVTPDGRPQWNTIARFLIEKEQDGETIEKFAENCRLDPFTTPKAHHIAGNPMLIKANWLHTMAVQNGNGHKRNADFMRQLAEA